MREFSIKNDLPPIQLPPMKLQHKKHTFTDLKRKRLNQSELGKYSPVDILAESSLSITERQVSGVTSELRPLKVRMRK